MFVKVVQYHTTMHLKQKIRETVGAERIGRMANFASYWRGLAQHGEEFASSKRKCVLIGTANYGNLGDLAISQASVDFIRANFNGEVIEIPTSHFWEYERCLKRYLTRDDIICFQGGGNMGDIYFWFENERCSALEAFSEQKAIVFPQTISYSSEKSDMLKYTKKVYSHCKDLHLFAREQLSKEKMHAYYPTTDVQLVPDIVLSLDPYKYISNVTEREGVLVMLRDDIERNLNDNQRDYIITTLSNSGMDIKYTDTVFDGRDIAVNQRTNLLRSMLTQVSKSKLVVTDRLHGMIFAAITNTPCIVFSNNNHKVSGVYSWIKDLSYVKYLHSFDMFETSIDDVMSSHDSFDRSSMLENYNKLSLELK